MARNKFLSALILGPMSFLYGIGVGIRNWMFSKGMLRSVSFDIPVIVVGNLTVGGTGKTPHTEYIVEHMRHSYNVGVLSRGYRRRTKGFLLAKESTGVNEIGDEPFQMFRKFGPKVNVAVCEKRVKGINMMLERIPGLNMVVLDDAFQHRYLQPSLSVVLVDYTRPIYEDSLLPYGRLREPMSALNRADVVVVTKCPPDVRPMDLRIVRQTLNLYPYQKLFFSTFDYGTPIALYPEKTAQIPQLESLRDTDNILSLTGIENPRPFLRYLRRFKAKVKVMRYPDHHFFTPEDFDSIVRRFNAMKGKRKYIFTTEKDAMRLKNSREFPESLKSSIFYIPIKVRFLETPDGADFITTLHQLLRNKNI